MNPLRALLQLAALFLIAPHLAGCASSDGPTTFDVAPGQYNRAFKDYFIRRQRTA